MDYLNAPWTEHSEPFPRVNMKEPPAPVGDIPAMLYDAFGMHELSPGSNVEEEIVPPQDLSTNDVERFYRLMEEGKTQLYPGCGKTKLDFILQLYNLKALNCWTDVSFTDWLVNKVMVTFVHVSLFILGACDYFVSYFHYIFVLAVSF